MSLKADARDMELIATRDDLIEIRDKVEQFAQAMREKVDGRGKFIFES